MTRIFTTIKKILLLLVLVSLTSFLHAQAPSITCPGTTVTYGDQSTNDPLLWNATVWWDPLLNSKDMAENAVPLEITITESNTAVTFTVLDEIGRVVYTTTNTYTSGYQSIVLDKSMVPQVGMYWYSLTTAQDKLVQKMIKF